ncbi:MAG: carbon-nitrogen hydrolase family protein [Desulfurococcales archaeon]|nr:carbon-nitrogen hydrolase family protein [Desulfurococcales archaeon]
MAEVKIGVLQFSRDDSGLEENVEKARELIQSSDADLIFMSENWLSRDPVDIVEYMNIVEDLSNTRKGAYVFSGCQYVRLGNTIRSVGLASVNSESRISCEKIYPSNAVGERGKINPGVYIDPVPTKAGLVGCIACVDIMYPEISRLHALSGALLVYNPASMPFDRLNLWHSIGVARAAENQVFYVGVNTLGTTYVDGRPTSGGSFVVDPTGNIVFNVTDKEGLFEVSLDLSLIDEIRGRRRYIDDVRETISPFYDRIRFMITHR